MCGEYRDEEEGAQLITYIVEAGEVFEVVLRRIFASDCPVVLQQLHDQRHLGVAVHEHFLVVRDLPQDTHVFERLRQHQRHRPAEKFPSNW